MHVLGINCVYHESAACLLREGTLVAAAEEERFNRRKHGKAARADNPNELPEHAIAYCLQAGGLRPGDVDCIAVGGDPATMERVYRTGAPSPWFHRSDHALFLSRLAGIEEGLRRAGFTAPLNWVPHHDAHAASAYHFSGFDDAAVLVVDALGDDAYSTLSAVGRGPRLHPVHRVAYPSSIGYLWELISIYLGFGVYDAAKVMGLAAYGDPRRFRDQFELLAWPTADGGFAMHAPSLRFSEICYDPSAAWLDGVVALFGHPPRRDGPLERIHYDVAAALQALTDELIVHMANVLADHAGSERLCLAGGVALNCVSNRVVFERGPFRELFVQPAANDAGLALGAAASSWREQLGGTPCTTMRHAYCGPRFDDAAIGDALARNGLSPAMLADPADEVGELISRGCIVANFDGAMELGPRALGNRSILADPRDPAIRGRMNEIIKHRESFRPLAPSVLAEEADQWFTIEKPTPAADFMLIAYPAKPNALAAAPAVIHADGSARIQIVRAETNPRFAAILRAFHRRTGVPMVLNTSYNDQEPIVCTPDDAIRTFLETRIDVLAIGPFLVRKGDRN